MARQSELMAQQLESVQPTMQRQLDLLAIQQQQLIALASGGGAAPTLTPTPCPLDLASPPVTPSRAVEMPSEGRARIAEMEEALSVAVNAALASDSVCAHPIDVMIATLQRHRSRQLDDLLVATDENLLH